MTHILYFSHKTASSSYLWYIPLKISFHKEKCCQLPFRSWCRRPASMLQILSEKNTIITKEPNVSSWALWDSRCIVISRIFCLWRFCSYTDNPTKKEGWKNMVRIISVRSVLCRVSHGRINSPLRCPKMQDVNIPTPLWNWRGRDQSTCMCLLLTYVTLNILQAKGRILLKCKATTYVSLIKTLTV